MRSGITGCGSYLPERVMTNSDLEKLVDTTDEWITQRTGIRSRHIAAEGETTSDMAVKACLRALEHAGITAADVDLVILATTTPDHTFPATAARVQARLGITQGPAFDIQAVCSGFIFALAMADNCIRLGQAKTALVIGAETFSRLVNWKDRSTCVLFGDGAGAVVVQAAPGTGKITDRGILSTHLHTDGTRYDSLYADGGPSTTGRAGTVQMDGQEVFRQAVTRLGEVLQESLAANGLTPDDIDWLVPHQANRRIIEGTARKLDLPADKVVMTVDRHGNTSAASIPLALDVAVRDGRIRPGQLLVMEAIGGGLSWGAAVVRW
ncbi:MAG: ketoacyl-ACP synthase III [Pseudomonadota bacterium]|nr:ketoacyl-ACP synthase III [Pseudomonadota bacterium]